MIDTTEFHWKIAKLRAALATKLRVKGPHLEHQIRRAGRRLPRRQRRAAAMILGAQDWMGHARLARLVDHRTVNAAFADLHRHLDRLDPAEARRTAVLRLVAGIVLNLIMFGGLLYLVHSFVLGS
ncbi:MAG: hypothetical protein IBX58_02805 [Roseovarius sp.]|nr:hypothetical protein [Roseovarius sp.]